MVEFILRQRALAHPQREPYIRAAAMRVAARLERDVLTVGSGAI
jgi:uncharacterized heparinase superfamily protein